MRLLFLIASLLLAAITVAQTQKASGVADFISIDTPVLVLEHVRVIDGAGTPAKEDQAVVIALADEHLRDYLPFGGQHCQSNLLAQDHCEALRIYYPPVYIGTWLTRSETRKSY